MTSAIDVTVPIYGNPTTKSVRDNFVTAHDEIGALQTDVSTRVKKSGDTMQGFLELYRDPEIDMQAATKRYVDSKSGGASLTVADTPPTIANGKMWFDSIGTQLYIGYDDGNTKQWVIATNPNVQQSSVALQPTYNNLGRNVIHNSMMNVAQRGTGTWSANNAYTVDRWVIAISTDTVAFTQVAITDAGRSQIGEEMARYALQNVFTGSATATAYNAIEQRIENLRRLSGKTITVSFYATATATLNLGVNIFQQFGTGGSPSASVMVFATGLSFVLGTTWQRYSFTFAMPSISGKTLGSNANDYTALRFYYSSAANNATNAGNIGVQSGTVQLFGIQLEISSVATPLDRIDYGLDLMACRRFYQANIWIRSANYAPAATPIIVSVPIQILMRTTATIQVSSNTSTNMTGLTFAATGGYGVYINAGTVTAAGNYDVNAYLNLSADL